MRLLPVNNIKTQQTNFKGLWGNTKNIKDFYYSEQYYDDMDYTESEYYPFNDETQEQISDVMKKHHTFKVYQDNTGVNERLSCIMHVGNSVKVMPKLAFSAKEWAMYIANQLKSQYTITRIEANLKRLNLHKHLLR